MIVMDFVCPVNWNVDITRIRKNGRTRVKMGEYGFWEKFLWWFDYITFKRLDKCGERKQRDGTQDGA